MKRILVVDDEVQILNTMSRMFLDTEYELITADNGKDALKLIEESDIDMIISDMRMPELDGFQLLSMIKEKYPKIIRIILSGYTDEKPMFRAILHNVAKLYVFKPWNNNDFLQHIDKLFTDDTDLNSSELANFIKDMGCTTTVPKNCESLFKIVEDEDMDSLILELEQDPDLTALLLQVAKSAMYGVMPNTIKQAANFIGLHNLKCFLRWACIANTTKLTDDIENNPELIWQHAYLTNRIFLFFYEAFLHKQPPESTMFAGLMHNIGLIILSRSLQKMGKINPFNLTANDYVRMETGEYEINHQEVGAHFLDQWDLPYPMYEVALFHHRPLEPSIIFRELVSAVHIAEAYAWKSLGSTTEKPVAEEVFESLGISSEEFEKKLYRYLK